MMWCTNLVEKHHVTLQSVPILVNGKSKNGALRLGQIYVNRVLEDILRRASAKNKTLQLFISYIKTPNKSDCKKHLKPYHGIFDELTEVDGVISRVSQIVIPESLQTDVIGLAHEGHQYAGFQVTGPQLWWKLSSMHNATRAHTPPVSLDPNILPDRPCQRLHADFKDPIEGKYLLTCHQYSKYPEVDLVTSTSFKKLKPVLNCVFATHSYPETVTTDNGPPYSSYEWRTMQRKRI